jgi:hypothetical protein
MLYWDCGIGGSTSTAIVSIFAVSFYPSRCRIVYPEWIFGGNRRVSIAGTVGGEEIYEGEMSTAYTAATKQVADNYNSIVDSREKRAGGPKAH